MQTQWKILHIWLSALGFSGRGGGLWGVSTVWGVGEFEEFGGVVCNIQRDEAVEDLGVGDIVSVFGSCLCFFLFSSGLKVRARGEVFRR